ncbi:SDR family NAD(P)-dependent oxidoreductase [Flavisolibacter ginsenosidimutans]|uniref:SDR family NAD(P)-dependent oxidoreductase n=1 Tax=Flavisolibacter ginsenosidimutans TaxID=661481 RepID=A0A5B8ULI8_9BACT|nr:SDR family NAD(P)-dependent oxidoreductase [Flavisolibacter ginsenosidimutans]QEC57433.1 SDR family NAD(P)-dependent oxidoreductase [Flavisolibacter ginsenosidimutans]
MILVTGGTGFLGSYIIKNLVEKGHAVRAIRRSSKLPFFIDQKIWEKVEWVEGDVLDVVSLAEAMKGIDAVIHSAAVVSFTKDKRKEMYAVNVDGTTNVVNAALESGVRRLLHVSSVAALGRTTKASTVTEEKTWEENKNNTHYAVTKHRAEMHAWRGFAEGLEGVVINPSTILGYGNWHQSSCAIFRNAYKGFPWYTKGVNGFVGVEDVAEVAVQLLLSDMTERRFIVNTENRSFQSLLNEMAKGFGKKPPHRYAGPAMSEVAWRMEKVKSILTGSKPLLSKETAKVAHSQTSFDNTALRNELPNFSFTPLDVVIKKACAQYEQAMKQGLLTL